MKVRGQWRLYKKVVLVLLLLALTWTLIRPMLESSANSLLLHSNLTLRELPAEEQELALFQSLPLTDISIWTDLPNAFPWRFCLEEYSGLIAPLTCHHNKETQMFSLEPLNSRKEFLWKTKQGHCLVPGLVEHEGREVHSLTVDQDQ